MLFPTFSFFVFFVFVFLLNWWLKRFSWKTHIWWRVFLLSVSYLFYATWDVRFLVSLFLVTVVNYFGAFYLTKAVNVVVAKRRLVLILSLDILTLAFFKYFNFFRENVSLFLANIGLPPDFLLLHVVLPVGLSFYILRAISYSFDVYRKKIPPEKSFLDLAVYISFFPYLLSGPILRADEFLGQLKQGGAKIIDNLWENLFLILSGLFKKIVVSSYLTMNIVDSVFAVPQNHSQLAVVLAVYAYALAIYCDFSGYTDLAIGIAGLMGFKSPANFNQPYLAIDFQDFWRRWHITLSNFLRDYVYIPLGGNRKGNLRTYVNLLITMFVSGLWHGTGLQFIIWGLFHGLGLAFSRFKNQVTGKTFFRVEKVLSWFVTLNAICFLWIFFRAENMEQAFAVIKQIFNWHSLPEPINVFAGVLIFAGFIILAIGPIFKKAFLAVQEKLPLALQVLSVAVIVILIIRLGPDIVPPFIYFNF